MTERTDHAHCALAWVKHAHSPDGADKNTAELLQVAQVHATLALVEQQRIANLIALWKVSEEDAEELLRAGVSLRGILSEVREALGL